MDSGRRTLKKISDYPELLEEAALWFSRKWNIPRAAYQESMRGCAGQKTGIPQWYIVLNEKREIVAGAGVIDNDFHECKDLSPNICALFVEEACRRQGIAARLLNFIRKDLGKMGLKTVYVVTDHTEFYEKCGWSFLAMVKDEEGNPGRMYSASALSVLP